jgi:hypothetical protein
MQNKDLKDIFELSKVIASKVIKKLQLRKFDRKFTKDKYKASSNDSTKGTI